MEKVKITLYYPNNTNGEHIDTIQTKGNICLNRCI